MIRFYRTSPKANLELPVDLQEIVVGSLLGDLTAERKSTRNNTRLHFKQSTKNTEYINHLYELFKEFCGSSPIVMSSFDSRPRKMKAYSAIKFQTLSLPCFNKFRELFYTSEGVKVLPPNLEDMLTAKGLAYWIMDDGYNYGQGFYICTESFTLREHEMLTQILKNKFGLESASHKYMGGYRLYIRSTSKDNLLQLIKPYLLNHFYYKFGLSDG